MTRVFLWGAGRCGRCLGSALTEAGHTIVGSWNRTHQSASRAPTMPWPTHWGSEIPATIADADVVWVTVVDTHIAEQAARFAQPHHVLLHASGALPARVLRQSPNSPLSVASCHPLQSFTQVTLETDPVGQVRRSTFGIEGEKHAVDTAQSLVQSMGARSFVVADESSKMLYHAACCVASNAMVALADLAVTLFSNTGMSREEALHALAPLIQGTADNLSQAHDPREVLTGPVHRGDVDVIRSHMQAIAERCPESLEAYKQTIENTLRLIPDSPARSLLSEPVDD